MKVSWDWVEFFINDWVNLVFFLKTHNQVFFSLLDTFDSFNFINKYFFPWIYRKLKKQLLNILYMLCGQKWANWKLTLQLEKSKILSIKLVDVKCPAFQVVGCTSNFGMLPATGRGCVHVYYKRRRFCRGDFKSGPRAVITPELPVRFMPDLCLYRSCYYVTLMWVRLFCRDTFQYPI